MNIFDSQMLETLAAFIAAQEPGEHLGRDLYRRYALDRYRNDDTRVIGRSTTYAVIEALGYERRRTHNSSATFLIDQPRQPSDALYRWADDNTRRPGYRP